MKNTLLRPLSTPVKLLLAVTALAATSQFIRAQTTTWAGAGADQSWSTPANWTTAGGSIPPAPTDNVIFPNGSFPVSPDGFDNIVTNNVTVGSLSYLNVSPNTRTTQINSNQTLTVNGTFTAGLASSATVVTMSGTGNFTVNNVSGNFNVGGNGATTATVTLTLADGTNTINARTLSLGESASTNGRQCIMNLGGGPTFINVDNINLGTGKASGTIQWVNPAFTNSLTIRDHTGTGRANFLLGNGTSGTGGSNGKLLLTGHPVDILATNIILGRLGSDTANQQGTLAFDMGIVDTTSMLLEVLTSSSGAGTANGSILTVGGNPTNTATLIVNSPSGPGGGSFIVSDSSNTGAGRVASATFNLLTNGVVQSYCPIGKATAANNTATINLSGTLTMEAATNTVGTRAIPIDNVTMDFATLNFAQDGSSLNLVAINLFMNDTNVVNITSLPPIIHLPTTIPIIGYTSLGTALNLGVGTLPGDYHGNLVDDGVGTISLVITSGTIVVAKQDVWLGGVNNNWDVSTLNWTNAGLSVTNYTEADFVIFNDLATTGNVTLLGNQHTPSGVTVNNNTVNYVLSGAGKISGSTGLVKSGSGSLTLSESGGDNFAGGIFVHGGTLVLDNANSTTPGGLTNDASTVVQIGNNDGNGVLPGGAVEIDGSLVFTQSVNRTVSSVISGSGSLIQNDTNNLTLTGANTYTGNTLVNSGTLTLNGAGAISSAIVSVKNAALNVNPAASVVLNSVTLTNSTLNIGAGTNAPAFSALSITNSTISFIANYNNVGGSAILTAGNITAAGTTNIFNVTAIQNLPLSPGLPFNLPLVGYSSATFSGGFKIGWTNLAGLTGYITNNSANNSIDLVITSAPQNLTWNGGSATGNNWSDAANWTGVPIVPLDALTFDGLLRTNNNNDTAAGTTYAGITFNNSSGDAPFTLNGAPINLVGTMINNAATVQTVNLGLLVNGACTNDGGFALGTLVLNGGITNTATGNQTVTLLNNGVIGNRWATNSGTNGGGQLTLQVGNSTAVGSWTILDSSGAGTLVQAGNVQLSVNSGTGGGTLNYGTSNSAPNVDAGYPSNGVVNMTGTAGTFNMNNGTLKANAVNLGGSGTLNPGFFNVNGGTLILGPGALSAAGGNGGTFIAITITNGSLYCTNGGNVTIAQRGSGSITNTGGLLSCNTLILTTGAATPGSGVVTLSGGRIICTNIAVGTSSANGWGTVNYNGGILQPATNTAALFRQSNLVPLTNSVQAGGAIIDTAGFNATFNWPLTTDPALAAGGLPDGGLTKLGAGTLTLSFANTYNGNTAIGGGTLIVNSVQGPSVVIVSNTATLGGNGVIGSNVTVNAGGTLAPGNNAIGTLTVAGDVTLGGTTAVEINKTLGTNDLLFSTNVTPSTITYGGTLNVTTVAGTLASTDVFKLFSASNYVGSFSAIVPATPGAGLTWNTNNLTLNGTLSITGAASPTTNANILSVKLVGTNLVVHGTNNNGGQNFHYAVLTTLNITNRLSNWTPVITNSFNVDGTFDYTSPIVPGSPRQFIDVLAVP